MVFGCQSLAPFRPPRQAGLQRAMELYAHCHSPTQRLFCKLVQARKQEIQNTDSQRFECASKQLPQLPGGKSSPFFGNRPSVSQCSRINNNPFPHLSRENAARSDLCCFYSTPPHGCLAPRQKHSRAFAAAVDDMPHPVLRNGGRAQVLSVRSRGTCLLSALRLCCAVVFLHPAYVSSIQWHTHMRLIRTCWCTPCPPKHAHPNSLSPSTPTLSQPPLNHPRGAGG